MFLSDYRSWSARSRSLSATALIAAVVLDGRRTISNSALGQPASCRAPHRSLTLALKRVWYTATVSALYRILSKLVACHGSLVGGEAGADLLRSSRNCKISCAACWHCCFKSLPFMRTSPLEGMADQGHGTLSFGGSHLPQASACTGSRAGVIHGRKLLRCGGRVAPATVRRADEQGRGAADRADG